MANVKLLVVRSERGCVVVPPHAVVSVGDTVTWKNRTGDDIVVHVPHDNFFGVSIPARVDIKITEGNAITTSAVANPGAGPRHFPYAIFCQQTRSFAEGNSSPQIIVE